MWVLISVTVVTFLIAGALLLRAAFIVRGAVQRIKEVSNPKPPKKRIPKRIQLAADNLKQSLRFLISTEGLTADQVRALVEISIEEIKAERGTINE